MTYNAKHFQEIKPQLLYFVCLHTIVYVDTTRGVRVVTIR